MKIENHKLEMLKSMHKEYNDNNILNAISILEQKSNKRIKLLLEQGYIKTNDAILKLVKVQSHKNVAVYDVYEINGDMFDIQSNEIGASIVKSIEDDIVLDIEKKEPLFYNAYHFSLIVDNNKNKCIVAYNKDAYPGLSMDIIIMNTLLLTNSEKDGIREDIIVKLLDSNIFKGFNISYLTHHMVSFYIDKAFYSYLISNIDMTVINYRPFNKYNLGAIRYSTNIDIIKELDLMDVLKDMLQAGFYEAISISKEDMAKRISLLAKNNSLTETNMLMLKSNKGRLNIFDEIIDIFDVSKYLDNDNVLDLSKFADISINDLMFIQQNIISKLYSPITFLILKFFSKEKEGSVVTLELKYINNGLEVTHKKGYHINHLYVASHEVIDNINGEITHLKLSYGDTVVSMSMEDYKKELKLIQNMLPNHLTTVYIPLDDKEYSKMLDSKTQILENNNMYSFVFSQVKKENFSPVIVNLTQRSLRDDKLTITKDEYVDFIMFFNKKIDVLSANNVFSTVMFYEIIDIYESAESDLDIYINLCKIEEVLSNYRFSGYQIEYFDKLSKYFSIFFNTNHISMSNDKILYIR